MALFSSSTGAWPSSQPGACRSHCRRVLVAVPLGFTINLKSLLAFIIVNRRAGRRLRGRGRNIYRHLEIGKAPMRAALDGTREIALPVLGSVAVSCCAFTVCPRDRHHG